MTTMELALELLIEIRSALARGTKHYNKSGSLLTTEKEIIDALLTDGEIIFEPAKEIV